MAQLFGEFFPALLRLLTDAGWLLQCAALLQIPNILPNYISSPFLRAVRQNFLIYNTISGFILDRQPTNNLLVFCCRRSPRSRFLSAVLCQLLR